MAKNKKLLRRLRIRRGIRSRISGTQERPRLSVFRSNGHIYAQIIDDGAGRTLASASSLEPEVASDVSEKSRIETSGVVGERVARRAKEAGIESVIFDRGGYRYHGRVKALAEGARKGGLQF